jgi:glycosyltransferase involved in cell wall biosynthesis
MNLLFDLTATQSEHCTKFHGGGLYGEIILFALLEKTKNIVGIYDSKRYINPKIQNSGIKLYDVNDFSPREIVKKENIDVFYMPVEPMGYEPIPLKRCIITWHGPRTWELPYDSIHFHYAEKLSGKIRGIIKCLMMLCMKNHLRTHFVAKLKPTYVNIENIEFITVSEHSKHSIKSFFPHLDNEDIKVFYSPLNDELIRLPPPKFEPRSYFLLTSSARWEKNNLRAVWAFDELFSQRRHLDFNVVLTGVANEKVYTRKLKNRNKFIFLDYVDRADLLSLHKNAYAFIYPSLNEGFGYPPLESMRYGVPVTASGTSSIPEICQNAVIYFDPYNVSEIKNRILQLLDKNIYAEYSNRAVERYKTVSEKQRSDLEKIVDFILEEKK